MNANIVAPFIVITREVLVKSYENIKTFLNDCSYSNVYFLVGEIVRKKSHKLYYVQSFMFAGTFIQVVHCRGRNIILPFIEWQILLDSVDNAS